MPSEYRQIDRYRAPVDETRCRASVHDGGRGCGFHQCTRKPTIDGKWCSQHSPAAEEKRKEEANRRYDEKWAKQRRARIEGALKDATAEQLQAELDRRMEQA